MITSETPVGPTYTFTYTHPTGPGKTTNTIQITAPTPDAAEMQRVAKITSIEKRYGVTLAAGPLRLQVGEGITNDKRSAAALLAGENAARMRVIVPAPDPSLWRDFFTAHYGLRIACFVALGLVIICTLRGGFYAGLFFAGGLLAMAGIGALVLAVIRQSIPGFPLNGNKRHDYAATILCLLWFVVLVTSFQAVDDWLAHHSYATKRFYYKHLHPRNTNGYYDRENDEPVYPR